MLSSRDMPDDAQRPELDAEARLIGRYLVGRLPPPELVARYRDACTTLFAAPVAPADAATLAFVHRHPWALPLLDAACGLLRPGNLLRSKVLVMCAILEASPAFADEFLPRASGRVALGLRLAALGTTAVGKAVLGAALLLTVVRPRP
jgi:hypothetical protein